MKKKTKTKTTFLPTNTTTFRVKLPTRLTYSLKFDVNELASVYDFRIDKFQCPPFRLSYQGLGEPLCFAAFGPFATCAFYLLHGSSSVMNHFPLSGTVLSASILVGFTTSLILFCSHFHQVEGDREVGKMSPLVRLGTKKGAEVVKGAIFMLYALLVAFGLIKALPLTCIIFMAKYFCVRLHALFGVALALGLVLARKSVDDPGRPPGIVLSAATSFWLPVPPKRVFDFLRDENSRNEVCATKS
ncbi:1,4-dihydroxy-2-naphthoate polyprenyltransferase, chloroplastic [Glycine soja]|uniref:1,4-dihydroxy-2-naphthoate polyprenyltransferase, chloroplastic n=1 Tax=Glycine soja TaxID=3848 RepID=A0A0B2S7T4_GLYSO|nr:1,4-dihydroxy-2-naphthoate polyprenyltransferase, chloroplastic [Glycine soja]